MSASIETAANVNCLPLSAQAAKLRQAWREAQGAATISLDECQIRVSDSTAQDPDISLERLQVWESPSRSMVAEMMILAGQIAATLGAPCGTALWSVDSAERVHAWCL